MSNRFYDVTKWFALVGLPALAVLVGSLGEVWGFDYATETALTIIAIEVFLGSAIGVSAAKYEGRRSAYTETKPDKGINYIEELEL